MIRITLVIANCDIELVEKIQQVIKKHNEIHKQSITTDTLPSYKS